MKTEENVFLKILGVYYEISNDFRHKENWLTFLMFSLIVFSIGSIILKGNYVYITSSLAVIMGIMILYNILGNYKMIKRKFGKECLIFAKYEDFSFKGTKKLLFLEKIKEIGYLENKEKILKILDEEIKYEETFFSNVGKFVSISIFIGGSLITLFIKLIDEKNLDFIKSEFTQSMTYDEFALKSSIFFFIILFIVSMFISYLFTFKTKKRKLEELKVFLSYYEVFYPTVERQKQMNQYYNYKKCPFKCPNKKYNEKL